MRALRFAFSCRTQRLAAMIGCHGAIALVVEDDELLGGLELDRVRGGAVPPPLSLTEAERKRGSGVIKSGMRIRECGNIS